MEQKLKHHKELVLSATFVGLVCGLVLTHQQAYAAQTPPVSNQQSQITSVSGNNLTKTAAVNQNNSIESVANSATSNYITTSTYSSLETATTAKQETAASDSTTAASTVNTSATVPAANGTNTSSTAENNQPISTATSSSNQDTINTTTVNPAAGFDTQTTGNQTTTAASSEQPDTNIIAQGTWGTSKWDYTHVGENYILHLHAGTLGAPEKYNVWDLIGIGSLNTAFGQQLTQIVIDPGVIANQDSRGLFSNLRKLKTIQDLENLDTSQVTDMSEMFYSFRGLTSLNLSNWDTSQVTNMSEMFEDCVDLTSLDLSNWNTSKVTNMYSMFRDSLHLISLNLSNWDTSQVTNMYKMFSNCNYLTSLNLSHWDTSKVTNMSEMFRNCVCVNHLVLGPLATFSYVSQFPYVPTAGTKIPGTDKVVTAPYWVATSGYQQGQRYTSDELQQLTGRDQVTTYDWDSQVPYQDTVESKSVTRTINVHYPDGQVKIIQDTVELSRKVKVKADGSKTYGEWSTAQWEAYTVPELAGYQANQSKIPAQTVDSNTTDTTIDILYEPLAQTIVIQYLDQGQVVGTQKLIGYTGETLIPNYHAPQGYEITSSPQPNITVDATGTQIIQVNVSHKITQSAETLTKTRTINIHLPNATVKTYRQVAVIKRNVAVDQVTGSKTYGPWHNNSWDAMEIPIIEGYTANQNSIAAQYVTPKTENETIDIFYVQD